MKNSLSMTAIWGLASAAAFVSVPAVAEPDSALSVSVVRTSDLDLTTRAGRQTLDHRLVVASYEVCGTASASDLVGQNRARDCRVQVLSAARARSEELAARDAPIRIAARR